MRYVDPRYPLSELTRDVIAGFYRTYDALGFGFLELPYKRALSVELRQAGLTVEGKCPSSCSTWVSGLDAIAPISSSKGL